MLDKTGMILAEATLSLQWWLQADIVPGSAGGVADIVKLLQWYRKSSILDEAPSSQVSETRVDIQKTWQVFFGKPT